MFQSILRLPAVMAQTGLGRSTIYSQISEGLWPKPVNLGARAVGWPSTEVEALISARMAGRTNDQLQDLVVRLEAARRPDHEVV